MSEKKLPNSASQKGSQKSNPEQQKRFRDLKDAYGSSRISTDLKFQTTLEVKNPSIIPYLAIPNQNQSAPIPNSIFPNSDQFSKRFAINLETTTIESKVIALLDSAIEVICVSSFILENNTPICDALYRASKRGVRIYLLLASEKMLANLAEKEDDERAKEHTDFLKESAGYMMIRCGELHAKYVLIDPNSPNAIGILLTANLTQRAVTRNNEIGVFLTTEEAQVLFQHFLYGFWVQRQHQYLLNPDTNVSSLESLSDNPGTLPMIENYHGIIWTSSDTKSVSPVLEQIIEDVRDTDELFICSWIFDADHPLSKKILARVNAKTKVLLRLSDRNYEGIRQFLTGGAQVRCHTLQHAKIFATPRNAIITTANFETHGLDSGFEAGILITDPLEIEKLKLIFNAWFECAEYNVFCQQPISVLSGKKIILIPETQKSRETYNKEVSIEAFQQSKTINQTWMLSNFIELFHAPPENLLIELQKQGLVTPAQYAVKTLFPVEIHPRRVPEKVSFVKTIEEFHIWQDNTDKKKQKKYLVINENPIKYPKKYERAVNIAQQEGALCVLY